MSAHLGRLALLFISFASSCVAWNTSGHRSITKAAVDALPERLRSVIAEEVPQLIQTYCMYPDRYLEMERFGFTRNSPGPQESADIHAYCVRPDGREVHSATWDRDEDLESVVYLFERILSSLSEKRPADAAKFMGTLSHFISDSLNPPHSSSDHQEWHTVIERGIPAFDLADRKPQAAGTGIMDSVSAILERIYTEGERNRKDLPAMARAAAAKDERALDVYRLRAGRAAAEILADNLYTLLTLSAQTAQDRSGLGAPACLAGPALTQLNRRNLD